MATNYASNVSSGLVDAAARARLGRSAYWFYVIGVLSIVNTAQMSAGIMGHFAVGLGITEFIDGFGRAFDHGVQNGVLVQTASHTGQNVAMGLDLVVVAVFLGFGYMTGRGNVWGFMTGMVIYALDAVLLLFFQSYFSVAIHGFVLFRMFSGLSVAFQMRQAPRKAPPPQYVTDSSIYQQPPAPFYPESPQQPQYQQPQYQPAPYQQYQQPFADVPGYQVPQYQQPFAQVPDYQVPQYQQPFAGVPGYQVPQYQQPFADVPGYQVPQYQQPFADVPEYQVPQYQPPQYQPQPESGGSQEQ